MKQIALVLWSVGPMLLLATEVVLTPFPEVPQHQAHMTDAEIAGYVATQEETGEAPPSVKSCNNNGSHKDRGTAENPKDCLCNMACDPTNPHGYEKHGSGRCATSCRPKDCKCKPPCI